MSARVARELRATSYGHEPARLVAEVESFTKRERLRRALRLALPIFFGSILIAPIPPLHWMPIAGLVVAIVLGRRRYAEIERFVTIEGSCPACSQEQSVDPPARTSLPIRLPCPGCGEFWEIA